MLADVLSVFVDGVGRIITHCSKHLGITICRIGCTLSKEVEMQ